MTSRWENAWPMYCRVDQLKEKQAYMMNTLCQRSCNDQNSRKKMARMRATSARMARMSAPRMSPSRYREERARWNTRVRNTAGQAETSRAPMGTHGQNRPRRMPYHWAYRTSRLSQG